MWGDIVQVYLNVDQDVNDLSDNCVRVEKG